MRTSTITFICIEKGINFIANCIIFDNYIASIMHAVLFYLSYPFIYLVALLPFRLLYVISDIFYYIMLMTGYRKAVIVANLKNSFPEKSEKEIQALFKVYYQYMCDLIFETLKTITLTAEEAKAHCVFHKAEWLDQLYEQKQSIIIVMGHYGNWELAGPSFSLHNPYQLVVIYRPLTNPYFENLFVKMRTKFGTKITPVHNTLREMVANRNEVTATAFIADQKAPPGSAYWTTFLHQDTAVFTGAEKLAKKFDYPVVYMSVNKIKRGYYEITPELLFTDSKNTAEHEISTRFITRLEEEIIANPSTWLWSHRRWKDKRPHHIH